MFNTDDFLDDLLRGRGRPPAADSERLAQEAQFLHDKPIEGRAGQSWYTLEGNNVGRVTKFQWWWEAIIDWMMTNPHKEMKDCAADLKVSKEYLYQLTKSDLFLERYRERVAAKNALLNERIVGQVAETAIKAVSMMDEQLDHDRARPIGERKIDLEKLSDVSERLLRSLGYGGKTAAATVVNVNQHIDTGANPEALRAVSLRLQVQRPTAAEPLAPKDKTAYDLYRDEVHLVAGDDIDPELIARESDG